MDGMKVEQNVSAIFTGNLVLFALKSVDGALAC